MLPQRALKEAEEVGGGAALLDGVLAGGEQFGESVGGEVGLVFGFAGPVELNGALQIGVAEVAVEVGEGHREAFGDGLMDVARADGVEDGGVEGGESGQAALRREGRGRRA